MPYSDKISGIYKIVNAKTGKCYVGQSVNLKKRIADHFCLLRSGKHANKRLQNSFNKHGEESFVASIEVVTDGRDALDEIELAFLSKVASFDEPCDYNISKEPSSVMHNRAHSQEAKDKISASKTGNRSHITESYRERLRNGQLKSSLANSEQLGRIRFVLDNPGMSYAEMGRSIGINTSSARRLYLKYSKLKKEGKLNAIYP